MRLFVTEFITGGGIANDPLPETLKQEGQLMLQAVLADCSKIQDIELVTTRDARIAIDIEYVEIHVVENAIDYLQQLTLIASQCDATWVIAPESEGVLDSIVSHLTKQKVTLINCDVESIRISGDKLACAAYLADHGIQTIPVLSEQQAHTLQAPVIIKDRYGAGCEGLARFDTGIDALQCIDDYSQWVVQPYLEGKHLSVSTLFSKHKAIIIALNEQELNFENNTPKLLACKVNAISLNHEVATLIDQINDALPGLKGYVGIDLVQVDNIFYVVDINPRLTSSYVGLSDVIENNPAELCINSVLDNNFSGHIKRNDKVVEVRLA